MPIRRHEPGARVIKDLRRACANPRAAWNYLRRWSLLARHAELPPADVRRYRRELIDDDEFLGHLERNRGQALGGSRWAAELYVVVRATRPRVVVETGVASGVSSAHILRALAANGEGTLHSIDLPNVQRGSSLPEGRPAGWIVPDSLRGRWNLSLGDSKTLLPGLLRTLDRVDVFFHDSDHSYENMAFEFEQAFPKLEHGGLILSDDSDLHPAWNDFCAKHGLRPTRVVHMGVTRKVRNL
jgi:predicted O-methyltransferase YrrM